MEGVKVVVEQPRQFGALVFWIFFWVVNKK